MAEVKKTAETEAPVVARSQRPGRNDPCYCGSGKKYKKCHLEHDEAEDRKRALAEAAKPVDPEAVKKEEKHTLQEQVRNKRFAPAPVKNTFTKAMFKRKTGES